MELQRIVWHWDTLIARLRETEPDLGLPLRRSCRPLEAERRADGVLTLALGCWWRPDLASLSAAGRRERLDRALGRMLEEQVRTIVVPWPGGMATSAASEEEVVAPDLLAGLPPQAREEAERCESPLQRYFYAHAYRRGLRPRCQHVVGRYRLDFAFPEQRVAAEVVGWAWRGAGVPREREEQLGVESWRVRWFSGSEVLAGVERCLDDLDRLLVGTQGLMTRRFREAPRDFRRPSGTRPRPDGRPRRR